jgi:hypothetical protein
LVSEEKQIFASVPGKRGKSKEEGYLEEERK